MRRTALFGETLRETPADADSEGHRLLLRGGFVQPLGAGIYTFLPLGERVKDKVERILREEMEAIGGQEVSMPVVHPAELWKETRRWYDVGPELVRFHDRGHRDLVLAMTHEEVVGDLLRRQIRSYRQLPVMLFQLQTKFRDEPRSRGGLIRVREFVMKDAYSCHATFDDLDSYYPLMYQAYFNAFRRSGIDVIAVEADVGMMGGSLAHEFIFVTDIGEDQLVLCDDCGYAANRQIATFGKEIPAGEVPLPLEEVSTPGATTIAGLADLLDIPPSRTAKAAFFTADGSDGSRLIFAVVRGDMEVNETKLARAAGTTELRAAGPAELEAARIVPGYASPIGISNALIVIDDLVAASPNLVAGANRSGFHLRNTNVPRDYQPDITADISAAYEGAPCPTCGTPVRIVRGVEVGNTFKLGTRYSEALGATYLDREGQSKYIVMGSYGIGVGRLVGCIAEACRDERGLIWPVTVAPYEIYLVGLDLDDPQVRQSAERVYDALRDAGIEVLYDDREERAGVKFNDADLLGMPLRLTVSRRTVRDGIVELKPRAGENLSRVPEERARAEAATILDRMREELRATRGSAE